MRNLTKTAYVFLGYMIVIWTTCRFIDLAKSIRGYNAFGGEYLILLYPLVIYIIFDTVKDLKNCIKK